jgi:hypothetical protein
MTSALETSVRGMKGSVVAAIVFVVFGSTIGRADVLVYKESCGHYAFEDWILTCQIKKNTFKNATQNDFWADPFTKLHSITICASFHNHGGLNVPATIVYNTTGGEQSMPTNLFDTVKFQGSLVAETFSWVGSCPRLAPLWKPSWTMRGELVHNNQDRSFTYTETLSNGRKTIGELRASCSYLEDN